MLREIYWATKDPEIRGKVNEATKAAKKMNLRLRKYKRDWEDTAGYEERTDEDTEELRKTRLAQYEAERDENEEAVNTRIAAYDKQKGEEEMEEGWGGWSLDEQVFKFIRKVLPEGGTILELGSGFATGELAKHYTMYSVEHDEEFLDKYDSTYIHAPLKEHKKLKNHNSTEWYDADVLREKLKGVEYDLLLVDGPPSTRSGFVKYIEMFDTKAIWIFDDAGRSIDRAVVNSAACRLDAPCVLYSNPEGKKFAVLNNPLLESIDE
jgi:hypothetical protein